MRISRAIADLFRERIVPTILRAGEAAERDAGVMREIGEGAKTAARVADDADSAGERQVLASEAGSADGSSRREPEVPTVPSVVRPSADDHFDEPVSTITQRSAQLGLHTPSQRALESSLFIDEPIHQAALISGHPRPELMFGTEDWAGYLDARAFTRRYGDQELSVPFMTELHQRVAQFGMPDAGVLVQGERWFVNGKPFTLEEAEAVEANPYLIHIHPGTVPLERNIGAVSYRLTDPTAIRTELNSLSDWYNGSRSQPGTDPYRLAAALQQRFVSIHPFRDYNGRSSRLLMNWSLESGGVSPSVLPDFNRDIFSTPGQWADTVRAGSHTFAERADRLQQLGATADPVQIFGLQDLQQRYRNYAGEIEPPEPGDDHDIDSWREFLTGLRSEG